MKDAPKKTKGHPTHGGYVSDHQKDWDRLAHLVARARRSVRRMSPEDLAELDTLYRKTTGQLARVATRTTDAKLNQLTAAAHSIIYAPPKRARPRFWHFLQEGFARRIARNWRYHATAGVLFFGGAGLAYFMALQDPTAAYAVLPAGEFRLPGSSAEQLQAVLRSGREMPGGEKFGFASALFVHNLQVGVLAMVTGVLAAVPTVFLVLYNGMVLGAFTLVHSGKGIHAEYWAWMLPHGITEIAALIFCGGIGLRMGRAVVDPGLLARGEAMRRAGADCVESALGVAVMLLFAALIESYLRQSHLSTTARLLFAAGSALFWIGYFARGFWRERFSENGRSEHGPQADVHI